MLTAAKTAKIPLLVSHFKIMFFVTFLKILYLDYTHW